MGLIQATRYNMKHCHGSCPRETSKLVSKIPVYRNNTTVHHRATVTKARKRIILLHGQNKNTLLFAQKV